MRIKLRELRSLIREVAAPMEYSFDVYGPGDDQVYSVSAVYNPMRPFDVEIVSAVDSTGNEVDPSELDAMGIDLNAEAMDNLPDQGDGIGPDYDDIHGKSGIDY